MLSRNETGSTATSARHVRRTRRGHPRKQTHLLRRDILPLLCQELWSGRETLEREAGLRSPTPSSPLTVHPRLALARVPVALVLPIKEARLTLAVLDGAVGQPRQALLHKPLDPLVGMTTAQAHRRGDLGDRPTVSEQ